MREDAPEKETEVRKDGPAESQEQNEKLQQRKYHFQLQPFNIERNTSVPGLDDLFSDKKLLNKIC